MNENETFAGVWDAIADTPEQASKVRADATGRSKSALAKEYGVSRPTLYAALKG